MNNFSISDIENLTGIKAHTLRIWEQRYSFLKPKRKESLHRTYDNEDLKQLLRVTHLYRNGYKISRIAALPETELKRLSVELDSDEINYTIFVNQLTEASLDLEQQLFETQLNSIILRIGIEKTVTEVLFPLLHKIGLLWLVDKVSPAQEHFASAIVIKKLLVAIDGLDRVSSDDEKRFLFFAPEKEHHEIPILLMNYLVKKRGIRSTYLGANTPLQVIRDVCEYQRVSHIYFHVITYLLPVDVHQYIRELCELFPRKKVICSGLEGINPSTLPVNFKCLPDQQTMKQFAASL